LDRAHRDVEHPGGRHDVDLCHRVAYALAQHIPLASR
jgi:hypothetical protein